MARHAHDRGGVHATAEQTADRPFSRHPAAHRLGEQLAKPLGIVLGPGVAYFGKWIGAPIAHQPMVGRVGDEHVSGVESANASPTGLSYIVNINRQQMLQRGLIWL